MSENFIDQSRRNWTGGATKESLKLGCLQRIANATEAMAQNHSDLQELAELRLRMYKDQRRRAESAERSNASLRGVVKKLKNRIKDLESKE